MSTPSRNARAPAAPQNVSVSGATENSPHPPSGHVSRCGRGFRARPPSHGGRLSSLAPKSFESASVERLLTIWIVATVAIEIGAGRMQLTTVPSGAPA